MKLITAVIQPERLPEVKKSLFNSGIAKMTVTNVIGCGQQSGYKENYRGNVIDVNLLKKIRIEIAVNEDFVQTAVDALIRGAKTGNIGDGKIFITELPTCIRIRTGEEGNEAIG